MKKVKYTGHERIVSKMTQEMAKKILQEWEEYYFPGRIKTVLVKRAEAVLNEKKYEKKKK